MTLIVSDRGLVELMRLERYLRKEIQKSNIALIRRIEKLDRLVTTDRKAIVLVERIKIYKELLKRLEIDTNIDSTQRSTMYEEVL
jgi:hypothetical protein